MVENLLNTPVMEEAFAAIDYWLSPPGLAELAWRMAQVMLVVVAAILLYKLGTKFISSIIQQGERRELMGEDLNRTLRLSLQSFLKYGLIFVTLIFTLEIFQIKIMGPEHLRQIGTSLIKVVGILVLAQLALSFGAVIIDQVFSRSEEKEHLLDQKRSDTLRGLLKSILRYGVYFVAGVMILDNFGVRTSSILAGAGIIGLAVGFGAQNLVRDIITGFFIIFEDQYSVGDYVTVAGVTGTVQDLGLRTTSIREWTGQIHIIPNGEVGQVTNFSRGQMASIVLVSIAYEEDIDQAIMVLTQEAIKARGEFPQILEDPVVQGVTELGASEVVLRVVAFTTPGEQWAMERELRKRFKIALDKAGIEIPYPRRVVIHKDGPRG
ncbi:MAG: mechanosensitive ion channel family protein [Bacillota bacterium]|nr:mechanosensitive ion channel family protein [Bacillota bacterium]